eukprot:1317073-Prymnesium_polylepis.1
MAVLSEASKPSIRRSSTDSIRRVASWSSFSREPASASSSSTKMTHGPSAAEAAKSADSCCSPCPTHLDTNVSSGA